MKFPIIPLLFVFLFFEIVNNSFSSSNTMLIEERKESYEACVRIRNKAPNLNLKCEDLLEGIISNEENEQKEENSNTEIKTLIINENNTRKVNKSEEIKLRKLIQKLSNRNNLRKD